MHAQIRGIVSGSNTAPVGAQAVDRVLVKFLRNAMPHAPISPFWPYMVRLVRFKGVGSAYAKEMVAALNEALGPVELRSSTIRRFDHPDFERMRTHRGEMRFIKRCSALVQSYPHYAAALSIFEEAFTPSTTSYARMRYLGHFTILLRMVLHERRN